eukprot:jgi/Mesen1/6306/ME000325S05439
MLCSALARAFPGHLLAARSACVALTRQLPPGTFSPALGPQLPPGTRRAAAPGATSTLGTSSAAARLHAERFARPLCVCRSASSAAHGGAGTGAGAGAEAGEGDSSNAPDVTRKAAALIIGNEILTGKIQDTNTATLAKTLFSRGVDMVRAEVVLDVESHIVDAIHRLRACVGDSGVVFTSGGIGPTHDDITYAALAAAFGRQLVLHEPTVEVLVTEGLWVPLVVLESNVYILPGVPSLFTRMLDAHKHGEGDLAKELTSIATDFPDVSIGSYPATRASDDFTTRKKR